MARSGRTQFRVADTAEWLDITPITTGVRSTWKGQSRGVTYHPCTGEHRADVELEGEIDAMPTESTENVPNGRANYHPYDLGTLCPT